MKQVTKIVLVVFLFILGHSLFADKIVLKDGGVVRGKVISEDKEKIVIANQYGNISIDKKNISKRIRPKKRNISFKNSRYSFKKKSWTKFAFLGTLATGLVVSSYTFDAQNSNVGLFTVLSFTGIAITFGVLDFVKYGRVRKKMHRLKIGYHDSFLMNQKFLLAEQRFYMKSSFSSLQSFREEKFNLRYNYSF